MERVLKITKILTPLLLLVGCVYRNYEPSIIKGNYFDTDLLENFVRDNVSQENVEAKMGHSAAGDNSTKLYCYDEEKRSDVAVLAIPVSSSCIKKHHCVAIEYKNKRAVSWKISATEYIECN